MHQFMQGWLGPPVLVGQIRKLTFNTNPTPLFVYGNLSIKKSWVLEICIIHINSGFGTKPIVSFALLHG